METVIDTLRDLLEKNPPRHPTPTRYALASARSDISQRPSDASTRDKKCTSA